MQLALTNQNPLLCCLPDPSKSLSVANSSDPFQDFKQMVNTTVIQQPKSK
jgi:hypothetical protein